MKSKGYTLIELSVAMAIAATLGVTQMQSQQIENSQEKARSTGKEMFQYNMALSNYLVANKDDAASVTGTHVGTSWLKDTTCGGTSTESYLPCVYLPDGKTVINKIVPTTEITVEADGSLQGRTVWSPIIGNSGEPDGTEMGIAAMVASGAYISHKDMEATGSQGPSVFCPDITSYSASIDAICGTDKNRIVSISSSLSTAAGGGTSEEMLRTDHGNTMKSAIEFDNGSGVPMNETGVNSLENYDNTTLRQIANVARIYNIGSGSEPLILGRASGSNIYLDSDLLSAGLLDSASVLLDGNVGIKGDAYMTGDLSVKGGIKSIMNIETNNRLIGNIVEANRVEAGTFSGDNGLFDFQVRTDRVYTDTFNATGMARAGSYYTKGNITSTSGTISGSTVRGNRVFVSDSLWAMGAEAQLAGLRIKDGVITGESFEGPINSHRYLTPAGDSKIENIKIEGLATIDELVLQDARLGDTCTYAQVAPDPYGNMLVCDGTKKFKYTGINSKIEGDDDWGVNDYEQCGYMKTVVSGGGECYDPVNSSLTYSGPVTNGKVAFNERQGWKTTCTDKTGNPTYSKTFVVCADMVFD